jgi:hypothetical protein
MRRGGDNGKERKQGHEVGVTVSLACGQYPKPPNKEKNAAEVKIFPRPSFVRHKDLPANGRYGGGATPTLQGHSRVLTKICMVAVLFAAQENSVVAARKREAMRRRAGLGRRRELGSLA